MTILLYTFFILFNLIFAYRKKDSKLLTVTTLIFIFFLMGGAGRNYIGQNDYINYQIAYDGVISEDLLGDPQIGFTLLMKLGNFLSLDFHTFHLIVIAMCLITIYFTIIRKYTNNSNYVLLAYMLYPMIIDSEQFRNFIALTILLIGIRFLGSSQVKSKIKFLFVMLIAGSFHTAFFMYIFLLFVNSKNKNFLAKSIAILTILFSVFVFLNNNQIPFLGQLLNIMLGDEKISGYIISQTNLGFLIPFTLHTVNFALILWARQIILMLNRKSASNDLMEITKINTVHKPSNINKHDLAMINLIYWVNVIGFIYFPLFMTSITFYRLVRNLLILNLIAYSIVSSNLKNDSALKLFFNLSVVGSLMTWLYLDLIVKTPFERVLIPFFTQNFFFN